MPSNRACRLRLFASCANNKVLVMRPKPKREQSTWSRGRLVQLALAPGQEATFYILLLPKRVVSSIGKSGFYTGTYIVSIGDWDAAYHIILSRNSLCYCLSSRERSLQDTQ